MNKTYKITKFLLVVLCIASSCTTENEKEEVTMIDYYYDLSRNHPEYTNEEKLSYINRAYQLSLEETVGEKRLKIVNRKSFLHHKLHQYDSIRYYDSVLNTESINLNNPKYISKSYSNMGFYQKELGMLGTAYNNFNQAKKYAAIAKDSSKIANSLIQMAYLQLKFGDYHGGLESTVEATKYLKNNMYEDLAILDDIAGTCYRKLGIYDKAISKYKNSLFKSANKDSKRIISNNLAAVYIEKEEYKFAIEILNKIHESPYELSKKELARVKDNLTYAKWLNNPLQDLEAEFLEAKNIRQKEKDQIGLVASYTHLAEYYIHNEKLREAIEVIKTGLELTQRLKIPNGEIDLLTFKLKINKDDIKSRDKIIFLKDSLDNENNKISMQFADIKFDNQKMQEAYQKQLRENEKLEAQRQFDKLKSRVSVLFIVLIIIVAIVIILYLNQKQQIDKRTIVYNTERRISKKLHDELANDVYNVMISLQRQITDDGTDVAEDVLDRIESIYKRTRDISKENNSIDTGEKYISEVKDMLANYISKNTNVITKTIEAPDWNSILAHKKIIVYRILQELMINMKKHSSASLVVMSFAKIDDNVVVRYVDNGVGASLEKIKSGNGLQNVENRIESIKGSIKFECEQGKGVKIEITFPR